MLFSITMQTDESRDTVLMNIAKDCIMTKTTQPLFSPYHVTASMNESIGNTTIGEAIARNFGILHEHFFKPILGSDGQIKLLEDIRAVTNDPALQAALETRWRNEDSQQSDEINTLLQRVRDACLYLELARAAEAHNEVNRAWAFNSYASVIVGEVIADSAAAINAMETDNRSNQNSKNGANRTKNFLPAKEEVVRLLEELKPEGGWPSRSGAASALEKRMIEFILKTRPSGLTSSNIRNLLERSWLLGDELVNSAWTNTKAVEKT